MNQERIIQEIAAYLERETKQDCETLLFSDQIRTDKEGFCKAVAAEIAATIAPHMEAGVGWEDAPEWAKYITTDSDGEVVAWEYKPKKGSAAWIEDQEGGRFETIIPAFLWEKSLKKRP